MDVPRFLVCNLAAADFFMGVYLGDSLVVFFISILSIWHVNVHNSVFLYSLYSLYKINKINKDIFTIKSVLERFYLDKQFFFQVY